MAAGDIKQAYAASSNLTVTNLHGIASSQTWVAGWTSAWIDNSSNLYLDYLISGYFTVEGANNQAGEIRVYVYAERDDSTAPDLFSAGTEGTEGTATVTDTEVRDNGMTLGRVLIVDNTASRAYEMRPFSVANLFGGACPRKFALFVTCNPTTTTTAGIESTGTPNQLTIKGVYNTVAQS